MNKILRNINYIIRIIIGVFFIIFAFQSCAHASVNMSNFHEDNKKYNDYDLFNQLILQTFNEDYENLNVNTNHTTQYQDSFNLFEDSNYVACYLENTTTQVNIILSYNDTFQSTKIGSIGVTKYGNGTFRILSSIINNTSSNLNGSTISNGLNKFLRLNNQWYNTTWNTLDYSPISFSFTIATNYSITNYMGYGQTNAFKYSYNNNQWLLGTMQGLEDITEVEFKLINLETNKNIAQCYKTGSISNMRITNNNLYLDSYIVYRDTPYRLYYDVYLDGEIIDSFWYNILFLDRNSVITNGVITNYGSGDSYSTQNAINDLYNNNSGDSGIIQKIYKDLFTIDSGDVEDLYNKLEGSIGSGDSFIVFYEPLKSMLESEPDDFVISWTDIPIFLTVGNGEILVDSTLITSGDINFSKYCRDNIVLGNIKFYINTILSLFLIIMLFHDIYKVLLKALGISTDIIDDMDSDESTTVYNSRTSLLDPETSEVVQSGLVRRTVTSRRRLK